MILGRCCRGMRVSRYGSRVVVETEIHSLGSGSSFGSGSGSKLMRLKRVVFLAARDTTERVSAAKMTTQAGKSLLVYVCGSRAAMFAL